MAVVFLLEVASERYFLEVSFPKLVNCNNILKDFIFNDVAGPHPATLIIKTGVLRLGKERCAILHAHLSMHLKLFSGMLLSLTLNKNAVHLLMAVDEKEELSLMPLIFF